VARPTADAIFAQLLAQTARLRPAPVFFANLGDFAGPGTLARHEHYLRLVADLPVPDVCIVGNHDLDAPGAPAAWARIHGPANFQFAYGHTRFVAIDAAPGEAGSIVVATAAGTRGPGEDALAYLAESLESATEPHRVVLMHAPPHFGGRYAPHPEWGFDVGERAFLELVRRHGVSLVCCAHALFFDHHVHDGTHFVVSGGGGSGLCSHFRGVCADGEGRPEDGERCSTPSRSPSLKPARSSAACSRPSTPSTVTRASASAIVLGVRRGSSSSGSPTRRGRVVYRMAGAALSLLGAVPYREMASGRCHGRRLTGCRAGPRVFRSASAGPASPTARTPRHRPCSGATSPGSPRRSSTTSRSERST
jgi:hypothetical protein